MLALSKRKGFYGNLEKKGAVGRAQKTLHLPSPAVFFLKEDIEVGIWIQPHG